MQCTALHCTALHCTVLYSTCRSQKQLLSNIIYYILWRMCMWICVSSCLLTKDIHSFLLLHYVLAHNHNHNQFSTADVPHSHACQLNTYHTEPSTCLCYHQSIICEFNKSFNLPLILSISHILYSFSLQFYFIPIFPFLTASSFLLSFLSSRPYPTYLLLSSLLCLGLIHMLSSSFLSVMIITVESMPLSTDTFQSRGYIFVTPLFQ
jgi:hypothetical protein